MTRRTFLFILSFILACIVLAFYFRSLHYEFIGLDDNQLVIQNSDIKKVDLSTLKIICSKSYLTLYAPVTMLSYVADYSIWRLDPFGYHFTNIVIHLMNCIMVLFLIVRFQKSLSVAFLTALVFAIHPVQIESVVWIAERKNLLSTFFVLLAFYYYWNLGYSSVAQRSSNKWLILCLLSYFLALLSKPSVVPFIIVLFFLNYFYPAKRFFQRNHLWFYIIIFILTAIACINTIHQTAIETIHYRYHGNSFYINLFVMLTVFWRYIGLLFYPFNQNILYTAPIYHNFFDFPVLFSAIGVFIFICFLYLLRKRFPIVCFGFIWYLSFLIPVSNVLAPFPSLMNDRYLYVALIGFFLSFFIMGQYVVKVVIGVWKSSIQKAIFILSSLFFISYLAYANIERVSDWKNSEKLFQSAMIKAPREDFRIFLYLGVEKLNRGQYEDAVNLFFKSLKAEVSCDAVLGLGTSYVALGRFDKAEYYLTKTLEIDPNAFGAFDQLGVMYHKQKKLEKSKQSFLKAIDMNPRSAVILTNYGNLLIDMGEKNEALKMWQKSFKLDPDWGFTLRSLSIFYFQQKQYETAAFYLSRYLSNNPSDSDMIDMSKEIEIQLSRKEIEG